MVDVVVLSGGVSQSSQACLRAASQTLEPRAPGAVQAHGSSALCSFSRGLRCLWPPGPERLSPAQRLGLRLTSRTLTGLQLLRPRCPPVLAQLRGLPSTPSSASPLTPLLLEPKRGQRPRPESRPPSLDLSRAPALGHSGAPCVSGGAAWGAAVQGPAGPARRTAVHREILASAARVGERGLRRAAGGGCGQPWHRGTTLWGSCPTGSVALFYVIRTGFLRRFLITVETTQAFQGRNPELPMVGPSSVGGWACVGGRWGACKHLVPCPVSGLCHFSRLPIS